MAIQGRNDPGRCGVGATTRGRANSRSLNVCSRAAVPLCSVGFLCGMVILICLHCSIDDAPLAVACGDGLDTSRHVFGIERAMRQYVWFSICLLFLISLAVLKLHN